MGVPNPLLASPAPASTSSSSSSKPHSPLSPLAQPFYPACGSVGRSKALRWAGESPSGDSDSCCSRMAPPASYLDVAKRSLPPLHSSSSSSEQRPGPRRVLSIVNAQAGPTAGTGAPSGDLAGCRRRSRNRRRKQVACGAGHRTPVHQRLGSTVSPTSRLLGAQVPGGGTGVPRASAHGGVRNHSPKTTEEAASKDLGVGAALGQGKDTTLQHCGRSSTIAPGQDLEAMVVSRPQLPDIPWDPMSCEWGVMSMPVTLVVDLHGCAGLMVQSTRSQSSRWTIAPRFRTGPSIPCWLKRRHV